MRKIMKKSATILAVSMLGCCSACNMSPTSQQTDNSSAATQNTVLYQMEDVVKDDLMWDTDTLFALQPEIRQENVDLGETIQTFKFKSASYGNKTNTWVFAGLGIPTTEKPVNGYPAVLLIHGGGGMVNKDWIDYWTAKGYVALAFDVFGTQLNEQLEKVTNPEGGPLLKDGSNLDSVENPDQSWVYHVVYNAIMCNNILRARKDVDVNRIVCTGNSWGGYATCLISGVDKRFAAFATLNGCGFVYRDTTWMKNGTFGGEQQEQWIQLYDPSSYLPYATKPMLFVSGVDDEYFSAYNRTQSAALIPGKTFYSQRYDLKHANWPNASETHAFFQHVLYGKDFTLVNETTVSDNVATLHYENKTFKNVYFVYTTSTDTDSHNWKWESVAVEEQNGVYSYPIPDNTSAYLFELEVRSNLRQSTAITIVNTEIQYQ